MEAGEPFGITPYGTEALHVMRAEKGFIMIGDETDGVGQDELLAAGGLHDAHRRVERGEKHILCHHLGARQPVEQRGFSGIGIAHQRDDRIRHLGARGTVQGACLDHLFQLTAQAHELSVDGAAVGLDLGFTGTANEAKPAALPFKVGPGPYQPCALVCESRHFDL